MTGETHSVEPRLAGWQSDFPTFHRTGARVIQISLEEFLGHASEQQDVAWERSIPLLQDEVREIDSRDPRSPATRPSWSANCPWTAAGPTPSSSWPALSS